MAMSVAEREFAETLIKETPEERLKRRVLRDEDVDCNRKYPGSLGLWCDDCYRIGARRNTYEDQLVERLQHVLEHTQSKV
jgi:hypothetical protein